MIGVRQDGPSSERRRMMASTDPSVDPAPEAKPTGGEVDEALRQRLFAVLHRELTTGCRQALARGITPERLAAHLDERTALLRAQTGSLPSANDPEDDIDDSA